MGPLQSMKNAFQNFPSMGQESGQLTHWLLPLLVESCLRQWTIPTHSSQLALSCCACVVWEGYCGSRESSEAKQTNKQIATEMCSCLSSGTILAWVNTAHQSCGWNKNELRECCRIGNKTNATGSRPGFSVCLFLIERSIFQCQGSLKVQMGGTGWQKSSLVFRLKDDSTDDIVSHILDTHLSILPIN